MVRSVRSEFLDPYSSPNSFQQSGKLQWFYFPNYRVRSDRFDRANGKRPYLRLSRGRFLLVKLNGALSRDKPIQLAYRLVEDTNLQVWALWEALTNVENNEYFSPETPQYAITGCKTYFYEGRFTWPHDSGLNFIASTINFVKNSTLTFLALSTRQAVNSHRK